MLSYKLLQTDKRNNLFPMEHSIESHISVSCPLFTDFKVLSVLPVLTALFVLTTPICDSIECSIGNRLFRLSVCNDINSKIEFKEISQFVPASNTKRKKEF